jgi:hypothetical protein
LTSFGARSREGLGAAERIAAMNEFANLPERLPAIIKALVVGLPAGYLFHRLHTPIPWIIGPMVSVAAFNLMGVRMHSPPYARQMGQVILGSAVFYAAGGVGGEFACDPGGHSRRLPGQRFGRAYLEPRFGRGCEVHLLRLDPGGRHSDGRTGGSLRRADCADAVAHSLRVSLVVILIPFALT